MSIRKVSDLEGLNLLSADNERLNKSLFEISYRTENNDLVQFLSMYTRFESLNDKIVKNALDEIYSRPLSARYGEYLSTFLCCNVETNRNDITTKNYISYLRFNTNNIVGETNNKISASENFFYGAFRFKSKDGTLTILSSNQLSTVFKTSPIVATTLATSTLDNSPNALATVKYILDKLLTLIPLGSIQYLDYLDNNLTSTHWFPLNGMIKHHKSEMPVLHKKVLDLYNSSTSLVNDIYEIKTYNNTTKTYDTSNVNIWYRKLSNGMKIASLHSLRDMTGILNATGSAWYYLVDNEWIYLPVNNNFICSRSLASQYGNYVSPGLPLNVVSPTGQFMALHIEGSNDLKYSGNFSYNRSSDIGNVNGQFIKIYNSGNKTLKQLRNVTYTLNAPPYPANACVVSKPMNHFEQVNATNSSYSVQPPAIQMQMYMYCY